MSMLKGTIANQKELTNYLAGSGVLKTPSIIKAFSEIDRADFVLPQFSDSSYNDHPLPINFGQTISQPSTVAFMLELLTPASQEKILDIGSGSGWTTALLAKIVGKKGLVIGVDIIPQMVESGKINLAKYKLPNATIVLVKNRELGKNQDINQYAPFDKILVSAASPVLPKQFTDVLKIKGAMVIPIKNSVWKIEKVAPNKLKKREFPGFLFVPLK